MRPIDICTAVLVTTGNRALREPAKTRWDAVEELLGLRLRPHSPFDSRVTFVDVGGEHVSFEEWLENRPAPSARLWLAPFPQEPSDSSLQGLPEEVREAIDSGGLGFLVYSDGQRVERFVPRELQPRTYELSGPQLHAFILGRRDPSALFELLASQLGVAPEALEGHLATLSPDDLQDVIPLFMSAGSNQEYASSGDEGPDSTDSITWNAFFSPSPASSSLSFEFLYAGPGSESDLEHDLDAARAELAATLEAVREFAHAHSLRSWEKHFRRALLRLSLEPQPLEDLVELLLLNALPTPAIQLALCAAASDVFGGMGSWNDMSFEDQDGERYLALSDRLFSSTRTALRTSLNRSAL
ncbi:hypothetical protein ATI61_122127 [Archangium gephyra]|uniref:Uncharacterized protein n=1 Tax=Archangium gephyra TaxID=48 RepID=A0AAC8PZV3_9BACT|nr:hypothetical protein [Archangium gephyra]AKI98474.1 Hypothetical protein AA314_00101 [Archangium gephyra]REG20427.1 hypothetical protein ATI61_122127 [Archangium gephyra]